MRRPLLLLAAASMAMVTILGPVDGASAPPRIAAWSGSRWLPFGTGAPNSYTFGSTVSGRTAYVLGAFTDLAGIAEADAIAAFGLPAPPSAPRNLRATAGRRKVTLAWTAPSTANGATIRDYVVQYRKKGTSTWRTFVDGVRTTRSATVTGLASGTMYQFRVLAKNDCGTGVPGASIAKKAG